MIEDIAIKPVGSDFDISEIRAHLDSLDIATTDPINPRQYLLSSDPDVLRDGIAQRLQEPGRVPYSLTVLFPTPSCILIGIRSRDTRPARSFVEWLRKLQSVRILDQDFNDFTEEAEISLDSIFGPDDHAL